MKKIGIGFLIVFLFPLLGMAQQCTGSSCSMPTEPVITKDYSGALWAPIPDDVKSNILSGLKLEVKGLVIVKFGGEWCEPCRILESAIKNDARLSNLWAKATVYNWDPIRSTEEKKKLRQLPGIELTSFPTVVFFKDGVLQKETVYNMDTKSFVQRLITLTEEYSN